jgi:hypothetical protein
MARATATPRADRTIRFERGWPDVAMVPPRLVLAELKTDKGKATPSQDEWLALLSSCPAIEVYLWRPGDFNDVVELLR